SSFCHEPCQTSCYCKFKCIDQFRETKSIASFSCSLSLSHPLLSSLTPASPLSPFPLLPSSSSSSTPSPLLSSPLLSSSSSSSTHTASIHLHVLCHIHLVYASLDGC